MQRTTRLFLAIAPVFTFAAWAAGPAIGFVQATGEFRLNQTAIRGNGTLFDGSIVETAAVRSDVSLNSGGHIALAPKSRTRIYKERAILESGAAEISSPGYPLIAANLSISGPAAQVAVDAPGKIRVGALSTPVEVRNSGNVLIARVNPGTALEFSTEGEASGAVNVTGTVSKEGDAFFITDKTTNVKYQLQGSELGKYVGKPVTVNGALVPGAAPLGSATGVVAVSSVAAAAGATAAAGGAAAGTLFGLGHAAIAGVAVGVATGGVVGGLAAAGTFSSPSASTP